MSKARRATNKKSGLAKKIFLILILLVLIAGIVIELEPNLRRENCKFKKARSN